MPSPPARPPGPPRTGPAPRRPGPPAPQPRTARPARNAGRRRSASPSDPLAGRQLVARHHLVTYDAQCRSGDPRPDVRGPAMLDELVDALEPGERGAGPDHHGDADPGEVLGPLKPVRILLGRRSARQPEPQEHHRAGRHV